MRMRSAFKPPHLIALSALNSSVACRFVDDELITANVHEARANYGAIVAGLAWCDSHMVQQC